MQKQWDNPAEHPMPEGVRVPASVNIGGVDVAPATILAPMAGVTDTVFWRVIPNARLFTHGAAAAAGGVGLAGSQMQSGCGGLITPVTSADGPSRLTRTERQRYPPLF